MVFVLVQKTGTEARMSGAGHIPQRAACFPLR